MEFSNEVLNGLNYLGNGNYFTDENYKKLVNSSLGLLSGESNIERATSICPEKGEIVKQSYSSLLAFTIECVRNDVEDEIQTFLSKLNFKPCRIEFYLKSFNFSKESIARNLKNCQSGWPNIVDTTWKLDFLIKSSIQNHIGQPLYYIVLTTEKDGKIDYVRFTCDLHQLQDLSTKLKEIVCHVEKVSYI